MDKGIKLTVTVEKYEYGTVELVAGLGSIDRGIEVTLTFENSGNEPVEQGLMASWKTKKSHVTLFVNKKKEVAPVAMRFAAEEYEFVPVQATGGIIIKDGCEDHNAVGLTDGGKPVGIGTLFCTKPGEKDKVVVMFPRLD